MKFGRLKELRTKAKKTQTEMGKILGVNQRTYSQYELNNRQISLESLVKLADYYGVSADYLLGRTACPDFAPLLGRDEILRLLANLDPDFPQDGWWLTSGAALVLFGVREHTHDVDLICTAETADCLEKKGVPHRLDGLDGTRIFALGKQIEILENWHTDEVIELDGLRVASLLSIRRQKEELGREKDLADIRLIDEFLRSHERR